MHIDTDYFDNWMENYYSTKAELIAEANVVKNVSWHIVKKTDKLEYKPSSYNYGFECDVDGCSSSLNAKDRSNCVSKRSVYSLCKYHLYTWVDYKKEEKTNKIALHRKLPSSQLNRLVIDREIDLEKCDQHFVYKMYSSDNELLYVGETCNIRSRLKAHMKDKPWWNDITSIRVDAYVDRKSGRLAESIAIRDEFPKYNISKPVPECELSPDVAMTFWYKSPIDKGRKC